MPAWANRFPTLRRPRLATAGALRLRAVLGLAALAAAVLLAILFLGRTPAPSVSSLTRTPPLDQKPGNANTNEYLQRLAQEKAQRDADAALATGGSYVPDMRGTEAQPNVQPPPAVNPQAKPPAAAAPPVSTPASPPAGTAASNNGSSGRTNPDDEAAKEARARYRDAMLALLASWGSKTAVARIDISSEEMAKRAEQAQGAAQARAEAGHSAGSGQGTGLSDAGTARPKRVVMPALRWVTGRTVIATNTDSGGPVVVELTSGPLAGDRLKGTAQKHEDRLTVTLTELTLADGRPIPVNAMLMAPDSKETTVASSVDHHYVPRIVLPTLAAGIQALGQALALSGSSVFSGPYGASQNYNTFNGGQLAGIAAGTAAGQLNQVLQQQTPKQSTVNLAANVDVGIMFLAPVED